jgi:putative sigma-54 modulation protein
MNISVTFRHMPVSESLKQHAIEKVGHINKFFDETVEAHIVFSMDRYLHKADVNLSTHGMLIRAEELSSDMYNSIDRATDKIEKQIKRYHSRLIEHRPRNGKQRKLRLQLLESAHVTGNESASTLPPTIVETKEFTARPMMLDEAVMQMDLLHNDILVFLNVKTEQMNILYRKNDNKYGLIEANVA